MKRITACLLSIIIITALFVSVTPTAAASEIGDLAEYVCDAVENLETEINVSEFGLYHSGTGCPELSELINYIRDERPELFYLKRTFEGAFALSYSYDQSYKIIELIVEYNEYEEGIEGAKKFVSDSVDEIIDGIYALADKTDAEKVLLVYDWIATHFNYDNDLAVFDVYTFLKRKIGVCQAYTGLFTMIMRKLGVTVGEVSSMAISHVWNSVTADGKIYMTDCTWGDHGLYGKVNHRYLLGNDTEFNDHGNDYTDLGKYNSFYSAASWRTSAVPFVSGADGNIYTVLSVSNPSGFNGGILSAYSMADDTYTEIQNIESCWKVSANSYFPGYYSSISANGIYVYFSDTKTLYAYDTITGKTAEVFTTDETSRWIYGFETETLSDGKVKITYEVASDPNRLVPGSGTSYEIKEYVYEPVCLEGHDFEIEITENPTAEQIGSYKYTCSCGEILKSGTLPVLGASYNISVTEVPTSETEGSAEFTLASDENAVITVAIPALSVENGYTRNEVSEPTAEQKGITEWIHPIFGTFETETEYTAPEKTIAEIFDTEINDGFITSIKSETKIETLTNENIAFFASDGETEITSGNIFTGCIIKRYSKGEPVETATAIVYGDANGDGFINSSDYVAVRLHILQIRFMEGAYYEAGNASDSEELDTSDYIAIRLHILEIAKITK